MNYFLTILCTPFIVVWWVLLRLSDMQGWIGKKLYRWLWGDKESDTHGSAKWATLRDLKEKGLLKRAGFFVGMMNGRKVYSAVYASVMVFAPKRQGKSNSTAAMMLDGVTTRQDWIIIDPEGGLRKLTEKAYLEAGYRLLLMDFTSPLSSNTRYNPLSVPQAGMPFEFGRDVSNLAMAVMPDDTHARDEHFQGMARNMLEATLLYLLRNEEGVTIYDVADTLTGDPRKLRQFLEHALLSPDLVVRQAAAAFNAAGDKERGSFITTLARKMKDWGSPIAKELLREADHDPWTFEQFFKDEKPSVLFLQTGLGSAEGAMARAILSAAINTRRRMHNHGHVFERWFRPVVDESLTIGRCEAIIDANNELGKAKVASWMAWLNWEDLKRTYGDAARGLLNNSDVLVFGGGKDMDLYKMISDMVGDKTIESGSVNENSHGESKGRSETGRKLIQPAEARMLPFKECIGILGTLAVKMEKPPLVKE